MSVPPELRWQGTMASVMWALAALCLPASSAEPAGETRPLRIALYDGAGAEGFAEVVARSLADSSEMNVERVAADDIRAGRLAPFDVLIQPGGSGGGQGRALGQDGRKQVRRFVKDGGGYVGFCAGAYLATPQYTWSLGLLDARVIDDEHWARGVGHVDLAVTGEGRTILGLDGERIAIHYETGPLLAPGDDPNLPDYESLAHFAGELAENKAPKGVMSGTTAIAAGRFGDGRVLCFSPHPEITEGLTEVVLRGIAWAAGHGK